MSGRQKTKSSRSMAMWIGICLTFLVLCVFAYFLFGFPVETGAQSYHSKWAYLLAASPNEIGDTLAGVAGALAFVWLVVTVSLQATELREQRKEFHKMAEAQQRQVEILSAQGEIFLDEQRQRAEDRAQRILEAELTALRSISNGVVAHNDFFAWVVRAKKLTYNDKGNAKTYSSYDRTDSHDQYFETMKNEILQRKNGFQASKDGRVDWVDICFDGIGNTAGIQTVVNQVVRVQSLRDKLPEDQKIRLDLFGFDEVLGFLESVISDPTDFAAL